MDDGIAYVVATEGAFAKQAFIAEIGGKSYRAANVTFDRDEALTRRDSLNEGRQEGAEPYEVFGVMIQVFRVPG